MLSSPQELRVSSEFSSGIIPSELLNPSTDKTCDMRHSTEALSSSLSKDLSWGLWSEVGLSPPSREERVSNFPFPISLNVLNIQSTHSGGQPVISSEPKHLAMVEWILFKLTDLNRLS
uniref:Uncharacterized protein n=1 Tax=Cacopsylla melanoneura TaxID=428564 RepID=A0A8D8M383_9HEMI